MAFKSARWYRIEGDTALVFDEPTEARAMCVSIVPVAQLAYYRANFHLRKCWP